MAIELVDKRTGRFIKLRKDYKEFIIYNLNTNINCRVDVFTLLNELLNNNFHLSLVDLFSYFIEKTRPISD